MIGSAKPRVAHAIDSALAPVPNDVRPRVSRSPEEVYLARLSPRGRLGMHSRLLSVARLLGAESIAQVPWESMRYHDVTAIRAGLTAQGLSPATVNLSLSALRGVAKEGWRLRFMSSEEYALVRDVESVRGSRLLAGREVAHPELKALLEVCRADQTLAGRRDAAAILLLYGGGLRRGELPELEVEDWDSGSRAVRVRHGKGNKEREVFVAHGTAQALEDWVRARGERSGKLFLLIEVGAYRESG